MKNQWYSIKAKPALNDYGVYINPKNETFVSAKEDDEFIYILHTGTCLKIPVEIKSKVFDEISETPIEEYYQAPFNQTLSEKLKANAQELIQQQIELKNKIAYDAMSPEEKAEYDKVKIFNQKVLELKGKTKAVVIESLVRLGYDKKFIRGNYPCDSTYFDQIWGALRAHGITKE